MRFKLISLNMKIDSKVLFGLQLLSTTDLDFTEK